ncbi:PREDICTED: protein KRI1 homolog [Rhagoletis zephyria]|uniref:protein KRI1 homolog n=1 Tax=Rhagoletis zephyria TaxID=28612 RepID=UPI00081153CA|nr:PREDICTED: protein KRI1 homolog [Rhagoletis zephyria]
MSSFTAQKAKLFDDSSDDDEVEEAAEEEDEELQAAKVLNVGNSYAQRYNDWRRKEELSKLKQKYGDHLDVPSEVEGSGDDDSGDDGEDVDDEEDSDVSSDDDDDDDSLHDDPFDEQFLKVYSALKNKAPEIYDKDFAAAAKGDDDDEDSSAKEEGATKKSPQKGKTAAAQKKFTLQDYHQKLIKEKKGVTEEDEQMLGGGGGDAEGDEEAEKPSGYYEELYNIRREIKDIARGENNFSDDDDDQLFSIKNSGSPSKKTTEPAAKKKDDQQKEQLISQIWSKSEKKASADTGDEFLKDYILNKRYLDPTLTSSVVRRFKAEPNSHFGGFEKAAEVAAADDNDSSEEDEEDDDDDDEQQKSSEPAIAKYHYEEPDATVIKRYPRAIDSIRDTINEKDKKSHRAEVRERKKAEKTAELKRLRRLKREEIEAKIAQLKAVSGASSFDVKDLDLNVIVDDENEFDGAKYDEKMNLLFGDEYYDINGADETKPSFEYVPEIDDDLYGDEMEKVKKPKKKRSKREIKAQRDIMADDDIGLFEDIIAGGEVATRFRYRLVEPNDFGLTDEEILRADDRELNKWCSLKKMSQYRSGEEEARDKRAYGQRKNNEELKRKILKSLYEEKKEGDEEAEGDEGDEEGGELQELKEKEGVNGAKAEKGETNGSSKKKRGKKRRKKAAKGATTAAADDDGNQETSASNKNPDEGHGGKQAESSPVKKAVVVKGPQTKGPTTPTNGNTNKTSKKRKRNQSSKQQHQPNKRQRGSGKPANGPGGSLAPGTDVTVQRLKAYGMSNRDIRKMNKR